VRCEFVPSTGTVGGAAAGNSYPTTMGVSTKIASRLTFAFVTT
jgi:hypothetical protein